jgi:Zn-dependent protease
MQQLQQGAFRLFRLFGIEVSLHWSWLPVEIALIWMRQREYRSLAWNVGECLSLFAIVLAHELGHALACRSVGGRAERILLWPLGGVAFVAPPARPGAVLWSIAAGPLVNLALLPVCLGLAALAQFAVGNLDVAHFFTMLALLNGGLLVFNLLPVYPLDGGQILQAILWFFVGRIRALRAAATIGLAAMLVGVGLSLWAGRGWLMVLALFGALRAWDGLRQANLAARIEAAQAAADDPTSAPR